MRKLTVAALGLGILLIAGCRATEPKSAIVDQLKTAGAADVSTASVDSLKLWLANHKDLARSLAPQCNKRAKRLMPIGAIRRKAMYARRMHRWSFLTTNPRRPVAPPSGKSARSIPSNRGKSHAESAENSVPGSFSR